MPVRKPHGLYTSSFTTVPVLMPDRPVAAAILKVTSLRRERPGATV